jgi:hypothetical protein
VVQTAAAPLTATRDLVLNRFVRRILVIGIALLAVTAGPAGSSATLRPAPAICVAKLTNGTPRVARAEAILLCAQPISVNVTTTGKWSTCTTSSPGPEEDCETGSWTARYRSTGALTVNGLGEGIMEWYGRATGTVTCLRDRENAGPDTPGTPMTLRYHRSGSFPIGQATVAAAARGSLMVVSADGAVTRAAAKRADATCGPFLLGSNDPTQFGKAVSPGTLVRKGTVRATLRQQGTVGIVAALVGGPLRGSTTVTIAIALRG